MLVDLFEGREPEPVILSPRLVVRKSAAPPSDSGNGSSPQR